MCQIRTLKRKGTKIIWWFVAVLETGDQPKLPGEEKWRPEFLPCSTALNTLTFQNDREVLDRACLLLQNTYSNFEIAATVKQGFPLTENPADSNQDAQRSSAGPVSKTAAKRAAKTAKALARQAQQAGQEQNSPAKVKEPKWVRKRREGKERKQREAEARRAQSDKLAAQS